MQRVVAYLVDGKPGKPIVYTTVYSPQQESDALLDLFKRHGIKGVVCKVDQAHA